jgi:hypothetical protein
MMLLAVLVFCGQSINAEDNAFREQLERVKGSLYLTMANVADRAIAWSKTVIGFLRVVCQYVHRLLVAIYARTCETLKLLYLILAQTVELVLSGGRTRDSSAITIARIRPQSAPEATDLQIVAANSTK